MSITVSETENHIRQDSSFLQGLHLENVDGKVVKHPPGSDLGI